MSFFKTREGDLVQVDEQDFDLAVRGWRTNKDGYAESHFDGRTQLLHQVIATRMGLKMPIDHWDRKPMNNGRRNLREATKQQNGMNRGRPINNTSGYKGVSKSGSHWRAYIAIGGRQESLGSHLTAEEAASAYNKRAKELFGDFAFQNQLETP